MLDLEHRSASRGMRQSLGGTRRNPAFPPPAVVAASLDPPAAQRVGWGFIALYTLAFMSTSLLFLAPCSTRLEPTTYSSALAPAT